MNDQNVREINNYTLVGHSNLYLNVLDLVLELYEQFAMIFCIVGVRPYLVMDV